MVNSWLGGWGKKPLFAAFADFCGVNTPSTADFKPPKRTQELESHTIALRSRYQSLAPAQHWNHSRLTGLKLIHYI